MTKSKISTKTIARIAAVQVLYQYNLDREQDINDIIESMAEFYSNGEFTHDMSEMPTESIVIKLHINYLRELVRIVQLNSQAIYKLIINYLEQEKELVEMQTLLVAILIVGIAELTYFPNVPSKVVINEYTNIAASLLAEQQVGFVNLILDKIASQDLTSTNNNL